MKKNLVVLLISSLTGIIFAEISLRKLGWEPGKTIQSKWFNPVDSLIQFRGHSLSDSGIFIVDTSVVSELLSDTEFLNIPHNYIGTYAKRAGISGEVAALVRHHADLKTDEQLKDSILRYTGGETGHFSFGSYLENPINKQGFYSIEYDDSCLGKAKIMIIGDSFVWGHSASNPLMSFSNRLLLDGYCVYNFGVSGADVPQYEMILKNYASLIDPDVVIISYYLGNDIQFYDREIIPTVPIFYSTNAGNLYSHRNGEVYYDHQQAYDAILEYSYVPDKPWYAAVAKVFSVTTVVWKVVTQFQDWWKHISLLYFSDQVPESTKNMKRLVDISRSLGYQVRVVAIPELVNSRLEYYEDQSHFFTGLDVLRPALTTEHYNVEDGHFNDDGHLFYANYLDELIQNLSQSP